MKKRASLLVAVAIALASPRVFAEPRIDPAVTQAADARFQEGLKLLQKKKYTEARAAFLQAEGLQHKPVTFLFLAVSSLKSGYPLEAIEYVKKYDDEVPDPPPKLKAAAEQTYEQAKAMLGHVKVIAPDGAEIAVDGKSAGKMPHDVLDLEPGAHTIKATLDDDSKSREVTVTAGSSIDLKLAVKPRAPGPPPPVKIKPPTPVAAPASDEAPGVLSPPEIMAPVYVAGAIGIIGLTSAVVFGSLKANADHGVEVSDGALARAHATREVCVTGTPAPIYDDTCSSLSTNLDRSTKDGRYLNISLGVGIGGVAVAVGWYLLAPKEHAAPVPTDEKRDSTVIVPMVGPRVGGVSLSRRF